MTARPVIKPQDAKMLRMFWETKEDFTRWVGWEQFKFDNPLAAAFLESQARRVEHAKAEVLHAIRNLEAGE
jgi:hypothetical protein